MLKDSSRRYGSVTRGFHWLVALLIVLQLTSVYANMLWDGNAFSQAIITWHTSIGVSLLALMALRTLWALSQLQRRPVHDGRLQRLAVGGHVVMYLLLILMPLSGVLMTWGMGYGIHAFGQVVLAGADVAWATAIGQFHGTIAWVLTALIVGHVAMALHHHFARRDDTLRRMIGRS
ncbi:cytochrome b [Salinicola avicenniae]|uniref:cytochrome b n=1 Tax=Salinicola avicenniae TaxID=2916836 RepID=UPI002073B13D|nr:MULTISPECIES: cytochrome b [unclassified Salinicola]